MLRETDGSLKARLKHLDSEIEKLAAAFEGYEGLTSIKGIGARSADVLLSTIGNVHDFENRDKLAAYFGMVPRVSQSNETDHRGKSPSAATSWRALPGPVQSRRHALLAYLKSFYERIRARRGSGKAIIAVARKLLAIIYDTLSNGWVLDDFTKFNAAIDPETWEILR